MPIIMATAADSAGAKVFRSCCLHKRVWSLWPLLCILTANPQPSSSAGSPHSTPLLLPACSTLGLLTSPPPPDVFPVAFERDEPEGFGGNPFGEALNKDGLKRTQA